MAGSARETPDAIGWFNRQSILIECKTSRADFKADMRKPYRRGFGDPMWLVGMGNQRYYLTPKGLLNVADFPDERWGLLETDGEHVRRVKQSGGFDIAHADEIAFLVSAIRRIGQICPPNMVVRFYTYETKQQASIGVLLEEGSPQCND